MQGGYAQEPLQTRNHRAISLLFYRFTPAELPLKESDKRWRLSYTNGNFFYKADGVEEDYEVSRLLLKHRKKAGSETEFFFEVPLVIRGSGYMDGIIRWWHENLVPFKDAQRKFYPDWKCRLFLEGDYDEGSAFGIGDLGVGLRWDFDKNHALRFALEVPTGNTKQLLGSGGVDFGFSLDGNYDLGQGFSSHLQIAGVVQGGCAVSGVRSIIGQGTVGLIYKNKNEEWILQWQYEDSPTKTGTKRMRSTHAFLTMGYRKRLNDDKSLLIFISEDRDFLYKTVPMVSGLAPDVSFGVTLDIKF